jgi:hypothetical protein
VPPPRRSGPDGRARLSFLARCDDAKRPRTCRVHAVSEAGLTSMIAPAATPSKGRRTNHHTAASVLTPTATLRAASQRYSVHQLRASVPSRAGGPTQDAIGRHRPPDQRDRIPTRGAHLPHPSRVAMCGPACRRCAAICGGRPHSASCRWATDLSAARRVGQGSSSPRVAARSPVRGGESRHGRTSARGRPRHHARLWWRRWRRESDEDTQSPGKCRRVLARTRDRPEPGRHVRRP